jgi:predicted DNA-binding transcriptional regulator AlpA
MRPESQPAPELLSQLVHDPARVSSVPVEEIPRLRGELARLDSILLSRLIAGDERPPVEERLLNAEEARQKLGVTKDWLYRHSHELPFTVPVGTKQVRFSSLGIDEWIQRRSK